MKAIETTGAGDTFCGCSINGVLKYGLDNLDEEKLKEILTYANAGAALITMKKRCNPLDAGTAKYQGTDRGIKKLWEYAECWLYGQQR